MEDFNLMKFKVWNLTVAGKCMLRFLPFCRSYALIPSEVMNWLTSAAFPTPRLPIMAARWLTRGSWSSSSGGSGLDAFGKGRTGLLGLGMGDLLLNDSVRGRSSPSSDEVKVPFLWSSGVVAGVGIRLLLRDLRLRNESPRFTIPVEEKGKEN